MAITTITAIDALQLAMRDRGSSFLSSDEYERILLSVATTEATFPARRIAAGYWVVPVVPLCLLAATFTEEPGASYELSCGGVTLGGAVSIKLTAGSDGRESIDITGCRVDFNQALAELLVFLANHRAQEYAQSMGGGAISPQTAREELLRQAEIARGVVAV